MATIIGYFAAFILATIIFSTLIIVASVFGGLIEEKTGCNAGIATLGILIVTLGLIIAWTNPF